jgi:alpha-L-fucosidase
LQEWLPLGLRVTRFAIDAADDGGTWREIASREMVGPQRIIRLPQPIGPRRLRFRTVEAEAGPALREFALFRSVAPVTLPPATASDPSIVARDRWTIVQASAPGAEAVFDNNPRTAWTSGIPASIVIDMGTAERLAGFALTPTRHIDPAAAPPAGYRVEVSLDGKSWSGLEQGEFPNINYARATQRITFASAREARYLRLRFDRPAVPAPAIAVATIGAFR